MIEDYDQAVEKFKIVQQVEDSRLVDETKVLIRVGELDFPVKVAATFQLANSYSNLAVVELDKATRSRDKSQAETHRQKAQKYFREAAKFFKEAGQSTNLLEIQVLSQYRLVKTYFPFPGVRKCHRPSPVSDRALPRERLRGRGPV